MITTDTMPLSSSSGNRLRNISNSSADISFETSEDLYQAIRFADWDKARKLLSLKDAESLLEYTDQNECNALHAVCNHIQFVPPDIIQSMLDTSKSSLFQQDFLGNTPLHFAVSSEKDKSIDSDRSDAVIIKLIESCPQAASITNIIDGSTPLHKAILHDRSPKIIHELLMVHPAAAIATNIYGKNPLHIFFGYENKGLRIKLNSIRDDKHFANVLYEQSYNCVKEEIEISHLYDTTNLLLRAANHETTNDIEFLSLHASIISPFCPPSFFRMILRVDPNQAYKHDKKGNFPIHVAAAAKSFFDGELYECWECDCKFNDLPWYYHEDFEDYCQECFEGADLREEWKKEFILMKSVDKIPAIIKGLLATNSNFASLPNDAGRLPLHVAIENDKSFDEEDVKVLFGAAPTALSTRDIPTHLYPFMLSVVEYDKQTKKEESKPSNELLQKISNCFALLIENPVLVSSGIQKNY